MYKLLRNILFLFEPEQVHYFSMNVLRLFLKIPFANNILRQGVRVNSQLEKTVFGLSFKNPVGLGAGFDKNAIYLSELDALGFGFVEIGTVTPLPQKGNDKPRLFRLPKDRALINRMGFNNDGVGKVVTRLKEWKEKQRKQESRHKAQGTTYHKLIIGGNIGKNKLTTNENAWKDYEICFHELFDWVDYFVVNVSSPNTPGLRELQQKDSLRIILSKLQNINQRKAQPKPLLVKISPDLSEKEIDDVIDLALELNLSGVVAANTTILKENLVTTPQKINKIGGGGLSGIPLQKTSTYMVKYISEETDHKLPVIASGGIFTGDDAKEKINAGAALVQVWTGFIYEGPSIVHKICSALLNNN
jgi:dihydroorotate dehydrogenase